MKKSKPLFLLSALVLLSTLFLMRHDIGANINDRYKQTLLEQYFSAEKTASLNVLESAAFCGTEETTDEFIIWVGIAVQSDLPHDQLVKSLEKIYEPSLNIKCIPYDMNYASTHGFTGIQKELWERENTKGHYLIGITLEPKTSIDKRNSK